MPVPFATQRRGSFGPKRWEMELFGFLAVQTLVETAQQGAAAGEIDAVLDDIGVKFGRRVAQCVEYGRFDARYGAFEAVCDLLVAD